MKNKNAKIILILILLFILVNSVFTLHQTRQAIVLQFGKPVRVIKNSGLHLKIPFIENIMEFDNRLLDLIVTDKEVIALDQKRLIVNVFAKFIIEDLVSFYNSSSSGRNLFLQLSNILESSLRQVVGSFNMVDLLSEKRTQIMQEIEDETNKRVKEYGIKIVDTRIIRADLPKENSEAIFRRMQTERNLEAKYIRSEGLEEAKKIKANADKECTIILAEAKKEAELIKGEGEFTAANIYNKAFGKDPEFYEFYKTMEIYKNTVLKENSKVIISQDNLVYKNLIGN